MSTKKTPIKKSVVKKEPVATKAKAVKKPKFKLISYTLKAVIPTGQYANIQPEITVQAETIEAAERAVMPYIETLFAKYREGGVKPIVPNTSVPPVSVVPVIPKDENNKVNVILSTPATAATEDGSEHSIVLTVPFNRAKSAIESCMSKEALKLVSDQVEKSAKLVDAEKVELKKLVAAKEAELK